MMFTITSTFASANVSLLPLATSLSLLARSVVGGRPANCITKYKQIQFHAKVIHHVNVYCSDVRGENERMACLRLFGIRPGKRDHERQRLCSKIFQSLGLMFTAFKVNEIFKVSKNLFSWRAWSMKRCVLLQLWAPTFKLQNIFIASRSQISRFFLRYLSFHSGQIDIHVDLRNFSQKDECRKRTYLFG